MKFLLEKISPKERNKQNILTAEIRSLVGFQSKFIFQFESHFVSQRSNGGQAGESFRKMRVYRRQCYTHKSLQLSREVEKDRLHKYYLPIKE